MSPKPRPREEFTPADHDRERARAWLKKHGVTKALHIIFPLKKDQQYLAGMTGSTSKLTKALQGKKAEYLARGIGSMLIGEGYLRPEQPRKAANKKEQQEKRYSGHPTGNVTLTHKGLNLLQTTKEIP